jgi:hypothetical protein
LDFELSPTWHYLEGKSISLDQRQWRSTGNSYFREPRCKLRSNANRDPNYLSSKAVHCIVFLCFFMISIVRLHVNLAQMASSTWSLQERVTSKNMKDMWNNFRQFDYSSLRSVSTLMKWILIIFKKWIHFINFKIIKFSIIYYCSFCDIVFIFTLFLQTQFDHVSCIFHSWNLGMFFVFCFPIYPFPYYGNKMDLNHLIVDYYDVWMLYVFTKKGIFTSHVYLKSSYQLVEIFCQFIKCCFHYRKMPKPFMNDLRSHGFNNFTQDQLDYGSSKWLPNPISS